MINATGALAPLGWLSIIRLGLVQIALGAIVVLTTLTLNRVMVVVLALPAMLPGALVDPYSLMRLLAVSSGVSILAFVLAWLAIRGIEGRAFVALEAPIVAVAKPSFRAAFAEVWSESDAPRFTLFVFISMLACSGRDLILEPFVGSVHSFTPSE